MLMAVQKSQRSKSKLNFRKKMLSHKIHLSQEASTKKFPGIRLNKLLHSGVKKNLLKKIQ